MNLRGSSIFCITLLLLIGLLLTQPAQSQSSCPLYWTEFTQLPDRPAGRRNHAMAYDSARGRTVLFGGQDTLTAYGTNELYGDTWEFDGYQWLQRFPAHSPPARFGHTMTYDAARRVTVLFGGNLGLDALTPNIAADVWEWNGNDWTQVQVSGSRPLERFAHGMAFDSVRHVHVMFGGVAVEHSGGGVRYYGLADTWEYDGAARSWTLRSATNPPAQVAALVFDAARSSIMLYSGDTGTPQTWLWNGAAGIWTQLAPPSSPRVLRDFAMAYDSERAIAVVFGGTTSDGGFTSDTWEWDGSTWHDKRGIAGQPYFFCCPRYGPALAYDSRRGQMVVFGGYGTEKDATWVLQPPIMFVDWQNSGSQTGSEANPFRTIRQAVDALPCGAIRIQPGDYAEGLLTIAKSVRMEARNGAVTIH